MTRNRLTTLLLIGLLTAFAAHVTYTALEGVRVDATADDLFSLSEGTQAILDKMTEDGVQPVELKLYFSESNGQTLPRFIKDFITYERYLRQLLQEYARAANGKIEIDFIDPLTDSEEEQHAMQDGLEGRPINQHGDQFFFGLSLQTKTGSKDAIPFLWPNEQDNVEYEISKRLHSLLWPSTQKVGVLSSLEIFGTADNPYLAQMLAAQGRAPSEEWISLQVLEETNDVAKIDPEADFLDPAAFDVIVVIHPKKLSAKNLWALDEWIVTGGNAIVFIDPYSLSDIAPQNPQQPWMAMEYEPSSSLEPLLAAWGIENPAQTFAVDMDLAVRRPVVRNGPSESVVIDLLFSERNVGTELAEHPILDGLSSLRFFLAGALSAREVAGVEITPLISTTASGGLVEIRPGFGGQDGLFYTDLNNAAKLRDGLEPADAPIALAYQIRGRLPSAYPNGTEFPSTAPEQPPGLPPGIELPPPEGTEMISKPAVPEDKRGDATVLLFSDVDVLSDQLAFQRNLLGLTLAANDNHLLLLNGIDHLLGADELMRVRAKRNIDRPFTLFDDIESAAEKETLERESQIRAEIEQFQTELQNKQNEITQGNAAIFQKRLQDEVDALNQRILEANGELREIRLARRATLEGEESKVRFAVTAWMPSLVLLAGIGLWARRNARARQARGRSHR